MRTSLAVLLLLVAAPGGFALAGGPAYSRDGRELRALDKSGQVAEDPLTGEIYLHGLPVQPRQVPAGSEQLYNRVERLEAELRRLRQKERAGY